MTCRGQNNPRHQQNTHHLFTSVLHYLRPGGLQSPSNIAANLLSEVSGSELLWEAKRSERERKNCTEKEKNQVSWWIMATDREQRGPHVGTTSERREKHVQKERKRGRKKGRLAWLLWWMLYILPKSLAFHWNNDSGRCLDQWCCTSPGM